MRRDAVVPEVEIEGTSLRAQAVTQVARGARQLRRLRLQVEAEIAREAVAGEAARQAVAAPRVEQRPAPRKLE